MINSIELIKDKKGLISGRNEFDKALLAHVSNNSESVTKEVFDNNVKPLLALHGITSICISYTSELTSESLNINIIKND
jgi:hypothetical protein